MDHRSAPPGLYHIRVRWINRTIWAAEVGTALFRIRIRLSGRERTTAAQKATSAGVKSVVDINPLGQADAGRDADRAGWNVVGRQPQAEIGLEVGTIDSAVNRKGNAEATGSA